MGTQTRARTAASARHHRRANGTRFRRRLVVRYGRVLPNALRGASSHSKRANHWSITHFFRCVKVF